MAMVNTETPSPVCTSDKVAVKRRLRVASGPGGAHPSPPWAVASRGGLVDWNFGRAWGRPLPGRKPAMGSLLLPALRVDSRRGLPPGKAGRVDSWETQKTRLKRMSAAAAAASHHPPPAMKSTLPGYGLDPEAFRLPERMVRGGPPRLILG